MKQKTKAKTKKVTSKIKSTDKERINLLKSELNYFKGLSIMAIVLILCVFFAFGSLFSAMYLEVKALRYSMEIAIDQAAVQGIDLDAPDIDSSDKNKEVPVEAAEVEWINFEKYGFNVHFPSSWTYLDNPYKNYEKTLDLYSDGQIHDYDGPRGDVIVRVVDEWEAPETLNNKKELKINDFSAVLYSSSDKSNTTYIVVIDNQAKFIEITFNNLNVELVGEMLDKFELTD